MKTIELKKRSKADDRELLKQVVTMHTVNGCTVGQMRTLVKIADKLDAANGTLTLEDTEYETLVRYFDGFQFAMAHQDIVDLADAIKGAVTVAAQSGPGPYNDGMR